MLFLQFQTFFTFTSVLEVCFCIFLTFLLMFCFLNDESLNCIKEYYRYHCIVWSICIAYCFVHIAICIVLTFSRIDPALVFTCLAKSCTKYKNKKLILKLLTRKIIFKHKFVIPQPTNKLKLQIVVEHFHSCNYLGESMALV